MNWKDRLIEEERLTERRAARKPRKALPSGLLSLKLGDPVYYRPTRPHPRAGSRAVIVRGPRSGVQAPSVRLRFPDGAEQTVPVRHVGRTPAQPETPPYLADARSRPVWKRIIKMLASAAQEEGQPGAEPLRWDAEERMRQLAGMIAPGGSEKAIKADIARVLLEAAGAEAVAAAARQAGRGGRGPVTATHLPVPTQEAEVGRLTQEQRAMINNIARCIHRRYFLSDKEVRDLSEGEREQAKIHGVLRQIIGVGESELGPMAVKSGGSGKGHRLHGELADALTRSYALAQEACQMLIAGRDDHALTLALQVQEQRLQYVTVGRELERARVKHFTGRYFHGDVLSVRVVDEDGGMTQYYTRLTIVYGEDGHSLVVANAAELEALTGTRVGPGGWADLCRWAEDLSDRAGGKKQGRRQDDDEHLIYRDHDGHLELRESVSRFPGLVRALECVRRALLVEHPLKDIPAGEIPPNHPQPGYHPPTPTGGLDRVSPETA
ncbi:hypothetical protein QOL99_00265 [Deinococcus sp. MIMF12]|uniref:Uncharacterized protein n=1 Tax=Deinococcus rhizophilus TaxID=3049544 RepID=A0ABT7JC21_9DEIO|nr:hypothetical protein [Deinococcus rhizophilus]MDL2342582.1 hypothetical protein [Deinococcus rhizophilus]